MSATYIEYKFELSPKEPGCDILMAELGTRGFESFVETAEGLNAYIQKEDWHSEILSEVYILDSDEFSIQYTHSEIAPSNWNESWEQSFQPITVANQVTVRAPFHESANTIYDIVIEPKMSFGTGHHETTHMMLAQMLQLDFEGKKVLDMGSGTAVLAILAEKLGAKSVDAIDIDQWCYENALENIHRNQCERIVPLKGDASLLEGKEYDIILANINRNILLADLPRYANCLTRDGELLLSGFLANDLSVLHDRCITLGFHFVTKLQQNEWISAFYRKH